MSYGTVDGEFHRHSLMFPWNLVMLGEANSVTRRIALGEKERVLLGKEILDP